jgi:hypothetical protein
MGRISTGLLAAAVLAGCSSLNSAMKAMPRDVFGQGCDPSVWVTGVIVWSDSGPAIKEDTGDIHPLIWGSQNTAVVEWDRRYRLGGVWFYGNGTTFWACGGADAVIPQ